MCSRRLRWQSLEAVLKRQQTRLLPDEEDLRELEAEAEKRNGACEAEVRGGVTNVAIRPAAVARSEARKGERSGAPR